jgi:type I restriction enzyme S subunit
MSFPRYPKYKDSGVEWLGEVPEHWHRTQLKRVVSVRGRIGFRGYTTDDLVDEGDGALALGGANLTEVGRLDLSKRTLLSWQKYEESPEIKVSVNDLVIGQRGTCGKVVIIDQEIGPATINPSLVLLKGPTLDSRFLCYWLMGSLIQCVFDSYLNATAVPMLSQQQIGGVPVCHPLQPEQRAIAVFLDRETAKIDGLVAEQRRLVELLKEKRHAVISHAVIKGLTPHAPMKPSGVEWLGDVPAQWEIVRFQRCVYVAEGQVDPEDLAYSRMSLIAPNHIESGTGRLLGLETADDQGAESGKYLCKAGDIVYSKIRPALRKVCIAPEDCLCSADMYPLRSHSGLTNPFLLWLVLSEYFSAIATVESQRVAMPKINRESLKVVLFAVPPAAEQAAIVHFLNQETAKLDTLTTEARRAIDLLQERRTALISAAVTGKIDVRDLAEAEAA